MTTTTITLVMALSIAAISATCVAAAAFLAWHQRKGWGWFLFAGFLIAGLCVPIADNTMRFTGG